MGKVILALGMAEELALSCPALAINKFRFEQVESTFAARILYVSRLRQYVQPGHEVVKPRVRVGQLCEDWPEWLAIASFQVDLSL